MSKRKVTSKLNMIGISTVVLLLLFFLAGNVFAILPDNLNLTIPDVTGDGNDDHLVLTKRSLRVLM